MDISDFTSKNPSDTPKNDSKVKEIKKSKGKYSRDNLKTSENCVKLVTKAVEESGLTMEEFHELRIKNLDLLEDKERDKISSKFKALKT